MILFADPGRNLGWAVFYFHGIPAGTLYDIGVGEPPPLGYHRLVIEKPHGGRGKASRKNLITLARRMQRVIDTVRAPVVEEVEPIRWKGQTDGDIMTRRIRDQWMSPFDRMTFEGARIAPSIAHNAIDAYGLGRWWFAKEGIRAI